VVVLTLAAELGDEIAERAVGEAELAGDVGQGTPLQEDGTQRFVAALLRLLGFAEKVLAARVIHDRSSEMSHNYRAISRGKW
jgi:hypothetical protein